MMLFGGTPCCCQRGAATLLLLGSKLSKKFINRAVLLDVARFQNVGRLLRPAEITATRSGGTAEAQGVEILAGDSVLIGPDSGRFFDSRVKYAGFRPGAGEGAANGKPAKDILVGDDNEL
jgi:hypothetical protein